MEKKMETWRIEKWNFSAGASKEFGLVFRATNFKELFLMPGSAI